MSHITLTINGQKVEAEAGRTIVAAAEAAGIHVPTLCFHPDLIPGPMARPLDRVFQGSARHDHSGDDQGRGCGLCVVEIQGQADLKPGCATEALAGMVVVTESERITAERRKKLAAILARHPHACLTCAQNEGCTRTQCSSNVPEPERCCPQLGHCELQAVSRYIGLAPDTPGWIPTDQPVLDGPLFQRNFNLCIGCTRCVRACRDLRGVGAIGFVRDGHGNNIIGSVASTLEESGCKFCTACVEVCPTGALMDKNVHPATRERNAAPCRASCPAGIDIPGYLRLIKDGRFEEAHCLIREKTPFPGVLGRICIRPCEENCSRGKINEPVAICALKRAAADHSIGEWKKKSMQKTDTGKKAAVIGAGPTGLSCAFYLHKAGHQVTVFEAEEEPGGMLRYGIPEYRLPVEVLNQEIQDLLDTGITLKTGKRFGRDFSVSDLNKNGFDAVFLGTGAQLARKIPVEGADKTGVLWGLEFLKAVRQGRTPDLTGTVVIVGGGNVAIDAALTARRVGANPVHLVCLEGRDEMPAHPWECDGAVAEGVMFHNGWGPRAMVGNQTVSGIELIRCTRVLDDKGVFDPQFNTEETKVLQAKTVILAVGQDTDPDLLAGEPGLSHDRGLIIVTPDQATSLAGVWAGGDATTRPGSVIHGIAQGRRAAEAMDRFLGGSGVIDETLCDRPALNPFLGQEQGFAQRTRETMPCALPEIRTSFAEVAFGFDTEQARAEASRCLQCDLRLAMGRTVRPRERFRPFSAEALAGIPETEGVFQLADADRNVLSIKGTMNLRKSLHEVLENPAKAFFFEWEADKMFTQRESEMLQQHLQKHGRLPSGEGDGLDDLF